MHARLIRWALSGAFLSSLALSGACSVVTPLPLTPIQIIEGTWPAKAPVVATASARAHTVAGDVFAYKALKFAITRASKDRWEFIPADSAVIVQHRTDTTEPKPVLTVQLLGLPADLDTALAKAKEELEATGAKVTVGTRKVSGVDGVLWTFDQKDAESAAAPETHGERIYVAIPVEGVQILAIIQSQTATTEYAAHEADFDAMIDSIILPGTQAAQAAFPDS